MLQLFVLVSNYQESLPYIVCSLLGLDFGYNIDPTMWYISYYYLWMLLFWCAVGMLSSLRLHLKTIETIVAILMLMIGGYMFAGKTHLAPMFHGGSGAWEYSLAFPIGICFSILKERPNIFTKCMHVLAVFVFGGIALRYYGGADSAISIIFDYSVAFAIVLLCGLKITMGKKLINFIGEYSFSIYLVEGFLINHRQLYFSPFPDGISRNVVCMFCCICGGILYARLYKAVCYEVNTSFLK